MESLAELEMKWGKCHKLHSYTVWTTPLVAPLLCVFLSLTLWSLIIISYYVHIFCLHLLFFASSLCLSFFIFCCNFLHNMTLSPYPNLLLMSLFHVYCQRLPSFNLYYLSLPSSLFISSCSLAFLTFIAPSPPPPYRRCDPHITHHELLRWNQHSSAAQQITGLLCFLSSFSFSSLSIVLFPNFRPLAADQITGFWE